MVAKVRRPDSAQSLEGRTLYIPQMAYAGARLTAAAFRGEGIDATVAPDSDAETLELGGLAAGGEECLPHKITLGDFLKVCRTPGFDPRKTAFFMATATGPCRFGQYAPYLKHTLKEMGLDDVMVFSPTSDNGYEDTGAEASSLIRTVWMAVVLGDILFKLLLKTRPYETHPGDTDEVFEWAIAQSESVLAAPGMTPKQRLRKLVATLTEVRDRFRGVPAEYRKGRPLIGLVGEIFCRLHTFSNDSVARRIESLGGECWISDVAEWVWYTNWCQRAGLVGTHERWQLTDFKTRIRTHVQHRIEKTLLAPLAEDFQGYEEPHDIREVLDASQPYLPARGCLGEMTLSVGKAIYLHEKGADGIIDISPFTCMNGIICEAVYPAVSADHDDLPIRTLYFDGVNASIHRDLEIFLDLARAYQRRKQQTRTYPTCFE